MNAQLGFLTYGLHGSAGGIGRYTSELLQGLRQAGVPLTVLQAGRAGPQNGIVGLPGARLLPGLLTLGQMEIAWAARHHQLALVHDPTGAMPLFLTQARRVTTIHDVIPYVYPETSTRLDWLIYRLWLPLAVRRLDAVITVSHHSKVDIVRYLPVKAEKVTVIPCAAGSQYRLLAPENVAQRLQRYGIDFPYILNVGSIQARKNLSHLLEAYAQLRHWSTRWRLVIVGARKWKSSPVYETVQRLNLAEYVHFTGYVEEEDLPALYNGADLFTFPSLYEGFGLPILEAMACGTPVITSNTSSLPEVAGDAALLVDPADIAEIAAAMRRILEDATLAADLIQRGLEQAALFSWERTARETIAIYEQVLAKR